MKLTKPARLVRSSLIALVAPVVALVPASGPVAADPGPGGNPAAGVEKVAGDQLTGQRITAASRVRADKAPSSRLAKTDPSLLGNTSTAPVAVIIKLDYDAAASYRGGIAGHPATSPSITGKALSGKSAAERKYQQYVAGQEDRFLAELRQRVPQAKVGRTLRLVYGGMAAIVPANRVADIAAIANVVAVQRDTLAKPLTDSSTTFIGANGLYPALGGKKNAGKGVIFGVLDSGAWPEHPSFADQGNLAVPPPKADGTPRACNFGDNPLTPAPDVFACSRKLIGGAPFLATYLSDPARAAEEPFHTARDSNGHGTHTGSTSAGNALNSAPVLGVDRGPLNGVAPGAWVSVYKVCGIQGCFSSDSAAAVEQAILDGVDVINFSISGGTSPFTDPVELAFLDAYAAGVFVAASAGNEGPGASTANHLSPWVTTVAASTQRREFRSTLTLTAGGNTATFTGASITQGVTSPLPVVLSSAAPYSRPLCDAPAPAGLFTGKIVACRRGVNARVEKGFNVFQGGAAGMILYNPTLADVETDNHWLPTVHLADGTDFLAFMSANPGATGTFTAGQKADGQGDVMAAFSSRGPAGHFIKPDVTAPGVQILAGHTPAPESLLEGPPGQLFQAIAGTSMSSPHTAGAAILLKAFNTDWTPGQIRSALMTTATTNVKKEDLTTPADPFDFGAGRIRVNTAGKPGITFDETAARMAALGNDPVNAVHLNIPSVNAPVMPGQLSTVRTPKNVSGLRQRYDVTVKSPAGSTISVIPSSFALDPNQSINLSITIRTTTGTGQKFGEIRLDPRRDGYPTLHMPVAWVPQQGAVTLASSCSPARIPVSGVTDCTVTAANNSFNATTVDLRTRVSSNLRAIGADNAVVVNNRTVEKLNVPLAGALPGTPSIAPGASPAGYLSLALFGVAPDAVGDEDIINYDVPGFVYAGRTYTSIGVDSNGYLVAGGGTAEDNECCQPVIPSPARPNNVLAPFWTDLDGTNDEGIRVATLNDDTNTWIVVEWQVDVFGTNSNRHFQVWLGVNGTEDISYAYDPAALPAAPGTQPLVVGAENLNGSGGDTITGLPTGDLRVTSSDPVPGDSVTYVVHVRGQSAGNGTVTTTMDSPHVPGTTVVTARVVVSG
jgi:hypothetical protein